MHRVKQLVCECRRPTQCWLTCWAAIRRHRSPVSPTIRSAQPACLPIDIRFEAVWMDGWWGYEGTECSLTFFFQFTATHPLRVEQRILARDPSVQSLLLVDNFCTANSSPVLARERLKNIDNSWKKNQYLMNTLYFIAYNASSLSTQATNSRIH